MDHQQALTLFKEKRFREVAEAGHARLASRPGAIAGDAGLIKLCDISLRAALLLKERDRIDGLLDLAGSLGALSHFRAAAGFADGDADAAWRDLANATPYRPDHHGWWSLGLNSIVRTPAWPLLAARAEGREPPFPPRPRIVGGTGAAGRRYAVVLSCDPGYFLRFYETCIRSLRATCRGCVVVCQVIDPTPACLAIIERDASDDVRFLVEAPSCRPGDKSYFASARFFAAEAAMEALGLPVFVFDIDVRFERDLGEMLAGPPPAPRGPRRALGRLLGRPPGQGPGQPPVGIDAGRVAARIQKGVLLPWQTIIANALYVPANEPGRAFLAAVCAYLRHVYRRSSHEWLWWIDQNALFFAYLSQDPSRFAPLPPKVLRRHVAFPGLFDDKDKFLASGAG